MAILRDACHTALLLVPIMCLPPLTTLPAPQVRVLPQSANQLARTQTMVPPTRRTNILLTNLTVSAQQPRCNKISRHTAPCMWPSVSTRTSRLTSLVCTRKAAPQVHTWEGMPSLRLVGDPSMELTTGKSRTAGMRSGATMAISRLCVAQTSVALRVVPVVELLQPPQLFDLAGSAGGGRSAPSIVF